MITPLGPTGLLSELSFKSFKFPSRIHIFVLSCFFFPLGKGGSKVWKPVAWGYSEPSRYRASPFGVSLFCVFCFDNVDNVENVDDSLG